MAPEKASKKKLVKAGSVRETARIFSVLRRQEGVTMIEILVVIAIFIVMLGFAALGIGTILSGVRANQAMQQVASSLREARMLAMSHNRGVRVQFTANDRIDTRIQIVGCDDLMDEACWEAVGNVVTANDPATMLGHGYRLMWSDLIDDMPEDPESEEGGSPGRNIGDVDFSGMGVGEPPTRLIFTSDGFLAEEFDPDQPVNGTIFLGLPDGDDNLTRAVTILGATGRVRAWRWRDGWELAR